MRRIEILPELGLALTEAGELAKAASTLQEAETRAERTGNEFALWRSIIARLELQTWTGAVASSQRIAGTEAAVAACSRLGDELGLARSWHLLALQRMWGVGSSADADIAFQQALTHARRAAARREELVTLQWTMINSWFGATAGSEGIRRCHDVLQLSNSRSVEATARSELGCFLAMTGRFDDAWAAFLQGRDMLEDLGQQLNVAGMSQEFFDIAMLAGDPAAAETHLRTACDTLERMGEQGFLATRLGCLAQAVYAQGRFAEAEQLSERVEAMSADDLSDLDPQVRWRTVRARVLALRGEHVAAIALARESVSLLAHTDWLNHRASLQMDLAEVLQRAGRDDEAMAALREGIRLYDMKENRVDSG